MICAIIGCNCEGLNFDFCKDTLKQRAGFDKVGDSDSICDKHYDTLIKFFTKRCRKCCDPFQSHANSQRKKGRKKLSVAKLIVITPEFAKKHEYICVGGSVKENYLNHIM